MTGSSETRSKRLGLDRTRMLLAEKFMFLHQGKISKDQNKEIDLVHKTEVPISIKNAIFDVINVTMDIYLKKNIKSSS